MRFGIFSLSILLICCAAASAGDWAQWRGPGHNNVAPEGESVPTEWTEKKHVLWRVKVPGRGHSSPVVVDDLIVLTSADDNRSTQAVLAFNRSSGEQLWIVPVSRGGFPKIHTKNTHASSSMAAANGMLFAVFGHHNKIEAVALDYAGKILWKVDVGDFRPKSYEYGYAASPTIYGDMLIVTGECDTVSWMKALDLNSGQVRWEQDRPRVLNWASPIVAEIGGSEQLLLSGGHRLASYHPGTGTPLWDAACLTMATCGTAVWSDGLVLASGGYPDPETVAVAADGSGRVVWKNRVKCYEQSMLVHGGYLYALADNGVAYCWEVKSGNEMWKRRLKGPVSVSPLLVDGNIYATSEDGTTFVFKSSPDRYQPVARNKLGDEAFASPAVADNVLYLRVAHGRRNSRQEFLYAISQK